jgi:hypothetical protein
MAGAWVGASLAHWIPGVVQLSGYALALPVLAGAIVVDVAGCAA